MVLWELYNLNQISFGCDAILSPIVVNTPLGSRSVLSDHSVMVLPFLPFSWPLCRPKCCRYVPFTDPLLEKWWEKGIPSCFHWASFILELTGWCGCGAGWVDGLWQRPEWRCFKMAWWFSFPYGIKSQKRSDCLNVRTGTPHSSDSYCPLP